MFSVAKVNEKLKYLTRYMIDLIMVDIQVKHYHPSLQAAAVLCLARKVKIYNSSSVSSFDGTDMSTLNITF